MAEDVAAAHAISNDADGPTRPAIVAGAFWALLTVAVWAAWPSVTRLSVTQTLTPQDLVALRYAVGGLVLLPLLMRQAPRIRRGGWREGFVLALFQGAPVALLVTVGVQYAPASHMVSLSPGPLALFAAVLGFLFFYERVSATRKVGLVMIFAGSLLMAGVSLATFTDGTWKGDLLFIAAGFMGSIYAVRMRRSGLTAMQGAAFIGVYSMAIYLPLYVALWLGSGRLTTAPPAEVGFQAAYQGLLMGALALFSFSRAIMLLGAARAAAFVSLVPVVGTVLGVVILNEVPSVSEICAVVAISVGVLLAAGALQNSGRGPGVSG